MMGRPTELPGETVPLSTGNQSEDLTVETSLGNSRDISFLIVG